MPTETRERARRERERGRRPAEHPDEIPGQRSIFDALDEGQDQEDTADGQT